MRKTFLEYNAEENLKEGKNMRLTLESLQKERELWEKAEIALPQFDMPGVWEKTKAAPTWIHFGAGNIFRGYIAQLAQSMLENGFGDTGVIAADCFDGEMIDRIYQPYDNMTLFVGLRADGKHERKVIASVAQALKWKNESAGDGERLREIFRKPSLQMVSFTITEKGYALHDLHGSLLPVVKSDIENGPRGAKHMMSIVTALLWERFQNDALPIAVVSMDNCSHNGDRLKQSVMLIAQKWHENGFVSDGFMDYLENPVKVSFPWSMIDKITPRPDEQIAKCLKDIGIEEMAAITTKKHTYIAPFVNAEIPQYFVIEDHFPAGRPKLEKAGVYFTDRETVDKTERMKVTTCLNPLHTALAVFGCLLGFHKIADEMQDADLKTMVERLGYEEGIPVVPHPGIIDPAAFLQEVIEQRLPNPFLPDTPQRIATDTSQKISIRFGETIKAYEAKTAQRELKIIPIVIAAWLRYLLGYDDAWNKMELSPDPMLPQLQQMISTVRLGDKNPDMSGVREILKNKAIFGTDLCANGLHEGIEVLFTDMIGEEGAVRAVLRRAMRENERKVEGRASL